MFEKFIKKVIARDGEREIIVSSPEEMHEFIVQRVRPEFSDQKVLGVKFLIGYIDDISEAEETSWFINPCYVEDADEYGTPSVFSYDLSTPKMASEFLPEIFLIHITKSKSVFEYFEAFHRTLMKESLTSLPDEEKLERFLKYLEGIK